MYLRFAVMLVAGEFGPMPAHTVIVDEILCKTCRTFFLVPVSKYEKLTNERVNCDLVTKYLKLWRNL